MIDSTRRFSSRVEDYIKYRPHYPSQVIETLTGQCGLTQSSAVADIGSGTGILAELFLGNGNRVFAVEPNREMREAGERLLGNQPGFYSLDGRAEATGLPGHSVDFVTAGQAFHWFDRVKASNEFKRILKPAGWVVLVWNERDTQSTPFLAAYERLLRRYGTDYEQVDHLQVDEAELHEFYGPHGFDSRTFRNRQVFDYAGARGRLLSSSYTPEPGYPDHEPMLTELLRIFQDNQENGRVALEYTTAMYYGRLQ
jgi:SAM-dependent methyltransferase